ncbi:MAG TPA: hypothetical protein VI077_11850 [Pseudolabrys sp.]|jgi:hypothetical protein
MRESRTRETKAATRWGFVVAAIPAAVIVAGKLPPALRRPNRAGGKRVTV